MGILVGFHTEGWDFLSLRSLVAALLGIEEDEIVADWIERPGRGWDFVLKNVRPAMQRFYSQCAQFAIFSVDNDGSEDLARSGRWKTRAGHVTGTIPLRMNDAVSVSSTR